MVLIENESNNAGIGDLFFLLDGKQVIDGPINISELILCIGLPEDEERVAITFVFGFGEVFEEIPVLFLDV